MKPTKTWILIANEQNARIVENDGPGKGLFQPAGHARKAAADTPYTDRPGRSFQSEGKSRSKIENHQNSKVSPNGFAGELIEELRQNHDNGHYDRLIICATPKMLAQITVLLPDSLNTLVTGEIAKDLTHVPTDKLPRHFENLLAV